MFLFQIASRKTGLTVEERMGKRGKLTTSEMMEAGELPDIILAGTCNYVSLVPQDGRFSIRNDRRDALRAWAIDQGLDVFEVQVDVETHGREYNWELDGPQEKRARKLAKLRVYQILPDAISVISHIEVLADVIAMRRSILWLPNGNFFIPQGLGECKTIRENAKLLVQVGPVYYSHLELYANAGRQIRNELSRFLDEIQESIRVHFGDFDWHDYLTIYEGDEVGLHQLIIEILGEPK
jgi:hypothetical protein